MTYRSPLFFLILILALTIEVSHAQQQSGISEQSTLSDNPVDDLESNPSQTPIFRSGINFIRVDVIVTDGDGNPVSDLEVGDFELFEDGESQDIESFQLIQISETPQPGAEPPRAISNSYDEEREAARIDTRTLIIFFDDYHVRFGSGARASRALVDFLENNLLPTDLVGIMYPLTPLVDVRLTRDHEAIVRAVEGFFGRKYDYVPRNDYEMRYAHYPTTVVERLRNNISLSALKGLMIHMGGLGEGRKNILLVSEGFTNYVPPELRSMVATVESLGQETASGNERLEETAQFFLDSSLMFDLREIYSMANRFNAAIYTLDPRGIAVSEFDVSQPTVDIRVDRDLFRATQNTLRTLAEQTDGRAIINQNNPLPGLRQMIRDSSAYYLIGYNSKRSPTDGKFHEIDVRVRRSETQVRHRQGFWAMTERDAERALTTTVNESPQAVDQALALLVPPGRGQYVRTWLGTTKGENDLTQVTFVWEPLSQVRTRGMSPSRVLLTAVGDAGDIYFRGRIPERDSSASGTVNRLSEFEQLSATHVEFNVEPGAMEISIAVEGPNGEILDRDRDVIDIPDFTSPDLLFSTPAFIRARNNVEWLKLIEDRQAIPTANREFRRTDRLLLRFKMHAPWTEEVEVKARLLNRGGDSIHPLDVQSVESGQSYQIDIHPSYLPSGEYVIELLAITSTDEATKLIAFRLVS